MHPGVGGGGGAGSLRGMTIRRSAAAVGAVALGLMALSACSKPTPLATVTVGDTSVNSQAERDAPCWNDGKKLSMAQIQGCVADKNAPGATVTANANDKVHLGVEPDIADAGWVVLYAQDGGQPQQLTNLNKKSTYTTLTAPVAALFQNQQTQATAKSVDLFFLKTTGDLTNTTQVWKFRVKLSS